MGLWRLASLSTLLSLYLSIFFFLFQPFTFSTMHKNNFADWGRSQAMVSQPGALAGSASVQTPTALTPLAARGLLQPAGAEARTSAGANRLWSWLRGSAPHRLQVTELLWPRLSFPMCAVRTLTPPILIGRVEGRNEPGVGE